MQEVSVANYKKKANFAVKKLCHVDPDDEKKLIIVERHSEMEFFLGLGYNFIAYGHGRQYGTIRKIVVPYLNSYFSSIQK